jgi:hypothetical protein
MSPKIIGFCPRLAERGAKKKMPGHDVVDRASAD